MGKLEDNKDIIISKYTDGYSASELAALFEATKTGIISLLKRNNIKTRTQTEARRIRAQKKNKEYNNIKYQSCRICKITYELNENNFYIRSNKIRFHTECKKCYSKRNKEYKCKNKKKLKQKRQNKKDLLSNYNKQYYRDNKDKIYKKKQKYRKKNRAKINDYKKKYNRNKYNNDLNFKLRTIVSKSIRRMLKTNDSSKNNESSLDYLPFTIQELKNHLESQFETWMTWDNWGVYDPKTWDDNDSSTWTWQIDHIMPHSKFSYTNMNDDSFKECWSLSNLRPLSAKQNVLDGCTKKRHE